MNIDLKKYPFPKRIRHHTRPNLYLPVSELNYDAEDYPPLYGDLDCQSLFVNGKTPEIIDIGCGKGKLLFEYALKYPDKNILGIEVRNEVVKWIDKVIHSENITNAGVLWYSVVNGLHFIADNSIRSVFYLFPDPWPKRKHLKRRAFNETLIKEILRVLISGGQLYLATDLIEVHKNHLKLINGFKGFDTIEISVNEQWELPVTNKQKFCMKNNIDYYRLICTKI